MTNKLTYQISALLLIIAMMPTILGLSVIHHYCSGCGDEQKQIAFFPVSHNHDNIECFCKHHTDANLCTDETKTCECKKQQNEQHKHYCFIDYKKLDYNCTNQQYKEQLPLPVKLDVFAGVMPEIVYALKNSQIKENLENFLFPPPLYNIDFNIFHCIFRL